MCVCVCARACALHLSLKFSYSFGSRYLCQQPFLLWGFCCNPSPWLLGPTRELLFPCLFLRALSHVLGYLKWEHSQSSGRNSSLNFPWSQLSSRQVASPPGKHEKEAFPGLFTSSTQGCTRFGGVVREGGQEVWNRSGGPWTSLVIQWLRPCASTAGGMGSLSGQGSCMCNMLGPKNKLIN